MQKISKGEAFRGGEVWMTPKGALYRVMGFETIEGQPSKVELRGGAYGTGRKVLRDWNGMSDWKLQTPEQVAEHWQLPIKLGDDWALKALPDRTRVILIWKPFGTPCGAVTVDEIRRTYAYGMDTVDSAMTPYDGPNWHRNLYIDAAAGLKRLLG